MWIKTFTTLPDDYQQRQHIFQFKRVIVSQTSATWVTVYSQRSLASPESPGRLVAARSRKLQEQT